MEIGNKRLCKDIFGSFGDCVGEWGQAANGVKGTELLADINVLRTFSEKLSGRREETKKRRKNQLNAVS